MSQNIASQPLRQGRLWIDIGKLVLAAVVQGVVVSAVAALVVMLLASGSVSDTPNPPGPAVTGTPAPAASVEREQG